jgi:hypothetical protein
MPRCGATFDENSVPPWTRGDFRGGVERGNRPPPGAPRPLALRATPPTEGISKGVIRETHHPFVLSYAVTCHLSPSK